MINTTWFVFGGKYSPEKSLLSWQENPDDPSFDLGSRGTSKHIRDYYDDRD